MSARYFLRCLGQPELRAPNGEPVRFRVRKHLGLLVYFAVEPRVAHHRDQLAELLWPDVATGEARHSLATALSVLRAKLGRGAFDAGRDRVRFVFADLDLDLTRLERGDVLAGELTPALEVCEFLDGFELPDAPEFMLWREQQRARWLPAVRDALVRQMDLCRRTGDFRGIEVLADRMLAIDELSEDAIRAKMEGRAFAGDRLAALKIFETWKEKLREELDAVPSDLVEGMAIRLRRRGLERTDTDHIPSVRTDQWKGREFIGRGAEYRALYEAWERTRAGEPRHAIVLGDSGVGKSTLVERVVTAASLEGAVSSRVQCYDVERQIPYAAVGTLVAGLIDRPGASGTPPEWLAELAVLVPAVRQRFANLPAPLETQGESARVRLAEAVLELLTSLSVEQPVILVVDDLHQADDASIAVLHLVLRRLERQPITAFFTLRPGELEPTSQGARLRENGARFGLSELELQPMTEEECGRLLASLVPPDQPQPSLAARRAIVRASKGFPMVLELLVEDWRVNGERCLALSVDAMTEEVGGPGAPAEAYRQIIRRMVQRLDPLTRNVLNLAAVLGARLNDMRLYPLVDLTLGQTMMAMARLTDLRVLRDGPHGLEFANELVRAQVYLSVPSSLRRVLHGQIAERLLGAEPAGGVVPGLEIAWHLVRSGRSAEAGPHLLRGAREAMRQGAPHEAERALRSAMGWLRGSDRETATLLLAEALQEQGRMAESAEVLDDPTFQPSQEGAELASVLRLCAAHTPGEGTDLRIHLQVLQDLMIHSSSSYCRVSAAAVAASWLGQLEDRQAAGALLEQIKAIRTADLSLTDSCRLAVAQAMASYYSGDRYSARLQLELAAEIARAAAMANATFARILVGLGALDCADGEYSRGLHHLLEAYRVATRLGHDVHRASAAINLAVCYYRLGDYHQQLLWADRALSSNPASRFNRFRCVIHAALARAMLGATTEARTLLEREDNHVPPVPWIQQAWALLSADVLHLTGEERLALARARRATTGQFPTLLAEAYAGPFARWTARLAVDGGACAQFPSALRAMIDRLDDFDKVDQVEVLSAAVWLLKALGIPDTSATVELTRRLANLPPAVADQLVRLRMLNRGSLNLVARAT